MRGSLFGLIALVVLAGCAAPSMGDEGEGLATSAQKKKAAAPAKGDGLMDRVVIGRMYQQDRWMVRGENAAYVADAIASMNPTFVSGLVRIAKTTALQRHPEVVADYKAVRAKVPNAKFDFVLNICDYGTSAEVKAKIDEVNDALGADKPEAFFFDFWDRPLAQANAGKKDNEPNRECGSTPGVVADAVTYAHAKGQLIGGNVWGENIPAHSDFLAVPDEHGHDATMSVVAKVRNARPDMPLMVHIENNPQKGNAPGNDGLVFVKAGADKQKDYIRSFVNDENKGYSYMMPVFFPMVGDGANEYSFDAKDAGILAFERSLVD